MASAVIGALRVNLGIDSAEFQDGLKKAQASLSGVGKSMQSAGKSMSAYLTAPIAAMGALTIKTAGDFEASMNRVQAASNASGEQFQQMQKLALELGANTSKSASEAADSMEMLAKNVVSAEDILGGAAAASIKLSEATGGDLSTAADVATNVMAQFKLEVQDLGRVVDGITNVTLASQFGFQDYQAALGQAGGVAGALGVSIEEFNAAIAATSSVFNSGSDAGTSFKTFLTTLVPKSDAAAAKMEELGLKFFNANGSMKSMSEIAEELKTALSGLSDEAKNNAVKEIFGLDAMRTAIALADQGAAGIDKMTEAVSRAGSADEQSAARMKGFNGEMEKLTGALETLAITIANSGLLEFATSLVSSLAGIVDSLATTNPELLKWGTVIAAAGAAIGPVVIALGLLVTAASAISAPVLAAVAAITAVVGGITLLYQGLQIALPYLQQFAGEIWERIKAGVESASQAFTAFKEKVVQIATDILNAFLELPGKMMEIGGQIMDGLWNGIQAKWESVKAGVVGIGDSITNSIKSTLGIHSPSRVMHQLGEFIMQGLNNGMQSVDVKSGVVGTANKIENAFQGIGSSIGAAIAGTKSWKDVLKDILGMLMQSAFSGFGGGGGGGFGGFLSGLFGSILGFARGGTILPGGGGGVDSQLVAFRKSPNERVDITKPGQTLEGGRGATDVRVYVDQNGNWQAEVERLADGRVSRAAPAIVRQSNSQVVPTMARYQNDKAGGEWRNG
ncbi:phage tail tape measure protein [Rhizobium sp. NTR19]|uniref:Phage tail tape measure protein n=1 Tax=Neorhizobium turbinariae TaxID=2937795 RepID=A0ABT0IRX4_9HYPH|nr:phage tail tape measure protein [Neorhizobium turbinariae]MCK8780564.1 phage tail tape measure protein [Neorhizobium turbinariae]